MKQLKPIFFNALLLLLVFGLSSLPNLHAQGLAKLIGDDLDNTVAEIEVNNGAVFACGSRIDTVDDRHATMAKYTLDGTRIWETELALTSSIFVDFAILPDGNIYAVGLAADDIDNANARSSLVAHFAPNGTLVGARTLNFPGRDYLRQIKAKPNGSGLIAIGQDNRGGTGTSDQGIMVNIDPSLNFTTLRHEASTGDSEWSQGLSFSSTDPSTLLAYGVVPAWGGDAGIAVANSNGVFSNAYRLSAPGTNAVFINDIIQGGPTNEYYLAGAVRNPGTAMLASLDHTSYAIRWMYEFPEFSRVEDVTSPNSNGTFFAIAYGYNGTTQSVVLQLQETPTGLQVITATRFQDGANGYISVADLDYDGTDLYYAHSAENPMDGLGRVDLLYTRFEADELTCIGENLEVEIVQREAVIQAAEYNQFDDQAEIEAYEAARELFLDQVNLCCGSLLFTDPPYTYDCAPSPTYTFTFDIVNNTAFPVTSVYIKNDLDPAQNVFLNLVSTPIAPGGVLTGQQLSLALTSPLTGPQTVCFDVIFLTDGEECCHFEQCIDIFPPDPCESISVESQQRYEDVEEGECCYDLHLTNDFCDDYFLNVTTEILTPGVTFTNFNSTLLNATINASETEIVWDNSGGFLPLGPLDDMSICLGNIGSTSQIPQEVAVHWYANDPLTGELTIVCSDTLTFECNPCMILEEAEPICDPATGDIIYNFTVTNMSTNVVTDLVFESLTPGININPPFIPVNLGPASLPTPGGSYSGSVQIQNTGSIPAGTAIQFRVVLLAEDGWCCHLETEIIIPECEQNEMCDCDDEEGFAAMLSGQAGLTHTINCPERIVSLATTTLTDCERTRWVLTYPNGEQTERMNVGNNTVVFNLQGDGEYQLLLEVIRYDDNGVPCENLPISSVEYLFTVDCGPTQTNGPLYDDAEENHDNAFSLDWDTPNVVTPEDEVVQVYPSPATKQVNITLGLEGWYQIDVLNISGVKLTTISKEWERGQVEQIEITQWPAGMYFLRAVDRNGAFHQIRFVKQ